MYVIAAVGLWRLWKARSVLAASEADHRLAGSALPGFGLWHLLDAPCRRTGCSGPAPRARRGGDTAAVAHRLAPAERHLRWPRKRPGRRGRGWPATGPVAQTAARGSSPGVAGRWLAAVLLVGGAALACLWPQGDRGGDVMVLFRPGISAADAMGRLSAADARVVWADRSGALGMPVLDGRRAFRVSAVIPCSFPFITAGRSIPWTTANW
ncbi:hypothetical protein [Paracidovorax cattleyae]|nr:hypothetical protein [Paracidovorax cattleyae]